MAVSKGRLQAAYKRLSSWPPYDEAWFVFADDLIESGFPRLGRRLASITRQWRRLHRAELRAFKPKFVDAFDELNYQSFLLHRDIQRALDAFRVAY